MAETYAPKLAESDDRIKTASISDASFTEEAYVESPTYLVKDAGVKEGSTFTTVEEAAKANIIEEEVADKSLSNLKEFDSDSYELRKDEAAVLETTGGDPTARATGEIIKVISEEKEVEKRREEEKVKTYFLDWKNAFVRAFKIALAYRYTGGDLLVEKELDRRKAVAGNLREDMAAKYSKVVTWSDRLRKAFDDSAEELAAPAEKDAEYKYEGK